MAHIRLDYKRIELSASGVGIGTGGEAIVRFRAGPGEGILATIIVDPSGTATVRRVSAGATIQLNGVALGEEPAPLLHGDWIQVAGHQLRFSHDRRAGSTVTISVLGTAAAPLFPHVGGSGHTAAALRAALAHIGREEQNDVIVADDNVSALNARVQRRESGWFVVDMLSTNGSYASGERAPGDGARKANPAVRFDGAKVIFPSEPESVDADGGSRMCLECKTSDLGRALVARRIVANRRATRVIPDRRCASRRSFGSLRQWPSTRPSFS